MFVILLQMLVPQDHAGLIPGACLEELHELCGEGWPVRDTMSRCDALYTLYFVHILY